MWKIIKTTLVVVLLGVGQVSCRSIPKTDKGDATDQNSTFKSGKVQRLLDAYDKAFSKLDAFPYLDERRRPYREEMERCEKELIRIGYYEKLFIPMPYLYEEKNKEDFTEGLLLKSHPHFKHLLKHTHSWSFNYRAYNDPEEDLGIWATDTLSNYAVYETIAEIIQDRHFKGGLPPVMDPDEITRITFHGAVRTGCVAQVDRLLRKGCDPKESFRGRTALHRAILSDSVPMVKLFLAKGVSPNRREGEKTYLQIACDWGNPEIVNLLLDAGAKIGETDSKLLAKQLIRFAAKNLDRRLTERLIRCGADLCAKDARGVFVLERAIEDSDFSVRKGKEGELNRRVLDYVKFLVDDQSLDVMAAGGNRLLFSACRAGNLPLMKYLIAKGCDKGATDGSGRTLLHVTAIHGHDHIAAYIGFKEQKQTRLEATQEIGLALFGHVCPRNQRTIYFLSFDEKFPEDSAIETLRKQGFNVRKTVAPMDAGRLSHVPAMAAVGDGWGKKLVAFSLSSLAADSAQCNLLWTDFTVTARMKVRLKRRYGIWVSVEVTDRRYETPF